MQYNLNQHYLPELFIFELNGFAVFAIILVIVFVVMVMAFVTLRAMELKKIPQEEMSFLPEDRKDLGCLHDPQAELAKKLGEGNHFS